MSAELVTSLPCPAWCGDTDGHPFDSVSPATGRLVRNHFRDMTADDPGSPAPVSLAQMEAAASEAGPVLEADPVGVYIDGSPGRLLTGPQARRVAAALLNAADLWDVVTG